ncbi:MAG: PH domain-containing protein [Holophagales bacterium]|nr:PH domain-containing protein [Holophagales bacterium]
MNTDDRLRSELGDDETLLWSAQPRQGLVVTRGDIPHILAGLWVLGLGIFFLFLELEAEEEEGLVWILAIGGVILLTLAFMLGRLFLDRWRRRHTHYGLTDRRILVVSGIFTPTVTSVLRSSLSDVVVKKRRDGSGTIFFGPRTIYDRMPMASLWPWIERSTSFESIPDVQEVARLVLREV